MAMTEVGRPVKATRKQQEWAAFRLLLDRMPSGKWFTIAEAAEATGLHVWKIGGWLTWWSQLGLLAKKSIGRVETGRGTYTVAFCIPDSRGPDADIGMERAEQATMAQENEPVMVKVRRAVRLLTKVQSEERRGIPEDTPRVRFSISKSRKGKSIRRSLLVALNEQALKALGYPERIGLLRCEDPKGLMVVADKYGVKLSKPSGSGGVKRCGISDTWYKALVGRARITFNEYLEAVMAEDAEGRRGLFVPEVVSVV